MKIYHRTTLGGLATNKLQSSVPSCYSKEFDDCLNDPNAYPGSQCVSWYANATAANKEDSKEYDKIIESIPFCSGSNNTLIAVAAIAGFGLLVWKLS